MEELSESLEKLKDLFIKKEYHECESLLNRCLLLFSKSSGEKNLAVQFI